MSSKKNSENEIIKFEQLNIDLSDLSTTTIKKPKIQETSTITLLKCFNFIELENKICKDDYKREIISTLNRRIIIPLYIPVLILISLLLITKSKENTNYFIHRFLIFLIGLSAIIISEMTIRFIDNDFYQCQAMFPHKLSRFADFAV